MASGLGWKYGADCRSISLCGDQEVDAIYLDFSKAFDSVDINVLLAKLKRYGIGGRLLVWISAWIRGRNQCVMVDGVRSPWVEVLSGVAQGSVLGPLLFLIYILDLESVLDGSICLTFADDTKLIKAISDMASQACLQNDLLRVTEWAKKNNMKLHEDKFQLLSYSLNKSAVLRQFPFSAEFDMRCRSLVRAFSTPPRACSILQAAGTCVLTAISNFKKSLNTTLNKLI
eukprot:sb/3469496/